MLCLCMGSPFIMLYLHKAIRGRRRPRNPGKQTGSRQKPKNIMLDVIHVQRHTLFEPSLGSC